MSRERKIQIFDTLFAGPIPCLIYCRNLEPDADIVELAHQRKVPVLISEMITSDFMSEIIRRSISGVRERREYLLFWSRYMAKAS